MITGKWKPVSRSRFTAKRAVHHLSGKTEPRHKLLAAMTVEEKIGQLNLVAAGFAVTGPVLASRATDTSALGT